MTNKLRRDRHGRFAPANRLRSASPAPLRDLHGRFATAKTVVREASSAKSRAAARNTVAARAMAEAEAKRAAARRAVEKVVQAKTRAARAAAAAAAKAAREAAVRAAAKRQEAISRAKQAARRQKKADLTARRAKQLLVKKPLVKPVKKPSVKPTAKKPPSKPSAKKPPEKAPRKPSRKPTEPPVRKKRKKKEEIPPLPVRSREAETVIQEKLISIQSSIGLLESGLDMAIQSFTNVDGTVDGELRISNLPEEWRTVAGVSMLIATLSSAFRTFTPFDSVPSMGGAFWAAFGIRFGPQNEAEIGELVELYKRYRGLFQIGTYPTPAWSTGPIQLALTGQEVGLRAMITSLYKARGYPPSVILIRFIWTPDGARPGHYKGEK